MQEETNVIPAKAECQMIQFITSPPSGDYGQYLEIYFLVFPILFEYFGGAD